MATILRVGEKRRRKGFLYVIMISCCECSTLHGHGCIMAWKRYCKYARRNQYSRFHSSLCRIGLALWMSRITSRPKHALWYLVLKVRISCTSKYSMNSTITEQLLLEKIIKVRSQCLECRSSNCCNETHKTYDQCDFYFAKHSCR